MDQIRRADQIPDWMLQPQSYEPRDDHEKFLDKTIQAVLGVLSKLRLQDQRKESAKGNVSLQLTVAFLSLVLISIAHSLMFLGIVEVMLLLILSMTRVEAMLRILKLSGVVTIFSALILLPAFIIGNTMVAIIIPMKVFASTTLIGLQSDHIKWNELTGALKHLHIPNLFLLILDITFKYLTLLGESALHMLYSLKLRSIGRNEAKYQSLGQIAGTVFLQSKEMAEEMYQAMECRGFAGEYHSSKKQRYSKIDGIYLFGGVALIGLYLYFRRY